MKTALVTRPSGQEGALVAGVEALGLTATHLACIAIEPLPIVGLADAIGHHDWVLFTSRNAVAAAHAIMPLPWWHGLSGTSSVPSPVHAIGGATADALRAHGVQPAEIADGQWNSEAFLERVAQRQPRSVLLIKGEGGRGLIEAELARRGIRAESVAVYRRTLPELPVRAVQDALGHPRPDVILIGSNETLVNLMTLADGAGVTVPDVPMIVNSQRCMALARDCGFSKAIGVAEPPGDRGQLALLGQRAG
ncbi:MAG: hypothetical protein CSA54_00760 [Gammaproteobacteria bacterium]|nr:MAG: hypothetical protein CSA54_00760 [Gammaproteobacteria bacterium]